MGQDAGRSIECWSPYSEVLPRWSAYGRPLQAGLRRNDMNMPTQRSPIVWTERVPPAGLEPALLAPEASTLSTELRGPARPIYQVVNDRTSFKHTSVRVQGFGILP